MSSKKAKKPYESPKIERLSEEDGLSRRIARSRCSASVFFRALRRSGGHLLQFLGPRLRIAEINPRVGQLLSQFRLFFCISLVGFCLLLNLWASTSVAPSKKRATIPHQK